MKLREKYKKYSILICLLFSATVLIGFGLYMNYAKGANTLYWEDITGSRDFLRGISIEGLIGDETHTRFVSIDNGEVKNTYTPLSTWELNDFNDYANPEIYANLSLVPSQNGNAKTTIETIDNPQIVFNNNYKIFPNDKGLEITVEADAVDIYGYISANFKAVEKEPDEASSLRFHTGLYVDKAHHNQKPIILSAKGIANKQFSSIDVFDKYESILPQMDSISWVKLHDKYYFTILNNENFSGMNNIYRIDAFGKSPEDPPLKDIEKYLTDKLYDSREYGEITAIADIPLEGNVQVFGLETVNDKLILLKGEEKRLVLALYDEQGKLLDRLIMPESLDASRLQECTTQTFNMGDTSGINIECWYAMGNQENAFEAGPFASIAIEDTFMLNYYFEETKFSTDYAVQYNGQLFLLSAYVDYLHPQLWKTQYSSLKLYGYSPTEDLKGKLIYEGKLISDIGDDARRQLIDNANSQPNVYTSPYQSEYFFAPGHKYDKRSYSSFTIKESGTHDRD